MNSMSGEKLKGVPYTGALPAVLTGTKAGYLHKYKIYGNTEQTGTPTPENPIEPCECGEKTANLFDVSRMTLGKWYEYTGVLNDQVYGAISEMKKINERQMTIKWHGSKPFSFSYVWFNVNKDYISRSHHASPLNDEYTNTAPSSAVYFILQVANGTNVSNPITYEQIVSYRVMLNTGSTALPYEPFGYKLPLTSGSTPVDIYLGESQTTRRIKKLVLTGQEDWFIVDDWEKTNTIAYYAFLIDGYNQDKNAICLLSSHYEGVSSNYIRDNDVECAALAGEARITIRASKQYAGSKNDFKAYLQQQYVNGTPVIVWCVIATPETSAVNEPLRKIGDYADTIDSTQTTTQIPTSANSTTISWAGSGLSPSEFDSIQEWVDTPTYTRVNGAWVEDN